MRKQVKNLLKREPYKTALYEAEISILSKKEKLMVYLLRRGLILSFYFIYSFYSGLKRIQKW